MAIATQAFVDITPAGLATQVNAWLATFITSASVYVIQCSVVFNALARRGAGQYQCIITTSNPGGVPSLATPFTLQFLSAGSALAWNTAAVAALLTPAYAFTTGFRVISDVREPALLPDILAWALTSATAGANANYVPS